MMICITNFTEQLGQAKTLFTVIQALSFFKGLLTLNPYKNTKFAS